MSGSAAARVFFRYSRSASRSSLTAGHAVPSSRPSFANPRARKGGRVPDTGQSFRSEPGDLFEAAVVGCRLELLEGVQAELVVQARRQAISDAGHRGEEADGVAIPSKPFEDR